MDAELLAACQELLRLGLPGRVPRELRGKHRFIPLAVDINGDLAVTAFIRRLQHGPLAGRPGLETSQFQRRDGTWAYLGGGAGEFADYPLTEPLSADGQGGQLRALSYGQTSLKRPRAFPRGTRRACHVMLRASAEICQLQAGARVFNVPFHGYAALIWASRRGPTLVALDSNQTRSASMDLSRDPFEVRHRRFPLR